MYEVTESDAEAIMKKVTDIQADDGVVRLRGLPFSSTEVDIAQFFSGYHHLLRLATLNHFQKKRIFHLPDLDIVENGITIITDHAGRNSGEAFVQFSSKEAAEKALQRDREVLGDR